MKIVIDISDDDYEYIKLLHEGLTDYQTTLKLYRAVKNGKPLPKGHGRLIDADALRDEIDTWGLNDYYKYDFLEAIDNAPTVERPHGEPVIKCKDCKYQKKYWHKDKRMKEKGYWIYGCELIDDPFIGTPVWDKDNQFCSSAEIKEVKDND